MLQDIIKKNHAIYLVLISPVFTYSNSVMETLEQEQCVACIQS